MTQKRVLRTPEAADYVGLAASTLEKYRLSGEGPQFVRLGGNLILTRLLFPEAFGLMAIVRLLSGGLAMFSDVGIPAAIIRHDRGDDRRRDGVPCQDRLLGWGPA